MPDYLNNQVCHSSIGELCHRRARVFGSGVNRVRSAHLFGYLKPEINQIRGNHRPRAEVAQHVRKEQSHRPLPDDYRIQIQQIAQLPACPHDGSEWLCHQQAVLPGKVYQGHRDAFVR